MIEDGGYWVIRTYQAGKVGEKTKYYVPADKSRNKRTAESCIKKQEQNESNATRHLARLLNDNFDHGDYLIGLDYSESGMKKILAGAADRESEDELYAEADHQSVLFLRRLKRRLPAGTELKYISVTSDREKNKRSGDIRPCRLHHHIVISGLGLSSKEIKELVVSAWGNGGVFAEHLYDSPDYWGLADYLMAQVRRIPNAKKYKPSRNLILHKPHDRVVHSEAELRLPKGATFLRRGEHTAGQQQYLRYLLPKKQTDIPPDEVKHE